MNRLLTISIAVLCLAFAAGSVQAAPPTSYTNFVTNGTFASAFSGWTRINANWDVVDGVLQVWGPTALGEIQQVTAFTAVINDPYNFTVDIGNTSSVGKTAVLAMYGQTQGFVNLLSCTFAIPANSPMRAYRMLGVAPATWTNIVVDLIIGAPSDSTQALTFDNVNVQYWPGSQVTSTLCTAPATPTPTHTPTATYTPSPTPTSTPALALTWALPTQVINGTPQPAQYVEFSHEMTAGDVSIAISVLALLLALVSVFVIWLLIGRNRRVD